MSDVLEEDRNAPLLEHTGDDSIITMINHAEHSKLELEKIINWIMNADINEKQLSYIANDRQLIQTLTQHFCSKCTSKLPFFPKREFQALMKLMYVDTSIYPTVQDNMNVPHFQVYLTLLKGVQNKQTYSTIDEDLDPLDNDVFTKTFQYLYSNPELLTLDFSGYILRKTSVTTLTSMFKSYKTLDVLNLSCCMLEEDVDILAKGLKYIHTLRHFDISSNRIHEKDIKPLAQALPNLTRLVSLNISHNPLCDVGIKILMGNLTKLPNLNEINIANVDMKVEGLEAVNESLRTFQFLQIMNISSNQYVTNTVGLFSSFKNVKALKELYLSNCALSGRQMGDFSIALNYFKDLTVLALDYNYLNRLGYSKLASVLPKLKCLTVLHMNSTIAGMDSNTHQGFHEFCEQLPILTKLIKLCLAQNHLTEKELIHLNESIAELPLHRFSIGENDLSEKVISSLCDNIPNDVTILQLDSCKMSSSGFEILARTLPSLSNLQLLNVRDNDLREESMDLFVNVIPSLPNLAILDFAKNGLKKADTIVENMSKLTSLTDLLLDQNNFEPAAKRMLQSNLRNIKLIL